MTTRPANARQIVHLDLDCFFVSVERVKNPSLVGKPVVVGGSPGGRGVVASASYEARAFGVRSAMPTAQAIRLCPGLIVARGSHGEYSKVSDRIFRRMCELAPLVERASIDELYLDLTGCEKLYGAELGSFLPKLQRLLLDEFGLPCTIALASNKTVAKIAAGTVKPAGLCVVRPGTESQFLAPLPVGAIPGVGKKTEEFLHRTGCRLISDLQSLTIVQLSERLGSLGRWLYHIANGEGDDSVEVSHSRKSISREETFPRDVGNLNELESLLLPLVEDVCSTLRRKLFKAKTVSIKLRYSDFSTLTRDRTIDPTDDDTVVFSVTRSLLREALNRSRKVRLLGVKTSGLERETQLELPLDPADGKRERILHAVDELRRKYGDGIIHVTQL